MNRKQIYWFSLALTAGLFLALAQGAVEVGRSPATSSHAVFGAVVGLLTLVWVVGVRKVRPEAFPLALSVLVAVGLSGLTGTATDPLVKVAHAASSHLAFALAAAGAAMISDSWEVKLAVADGGFPTLRSLAWLTPATVVMQIALGAAYRHKMTGLIPHVSWAFVAAIFVIMTAAFTMTQCGKHPALKKLSIWLISITGVQLILGVVALIGRLAEAEASRSAWMVASTTSHVLTGAVVLALTMALGAQTLRHVEPAGATDLAATGQNG